MLYVVNPYNHIETRASTNALLSKNSSVKRKGHHNTKIFDIDRYYDILWRIDSLGHLAHSSRETIM